MKIILGDNQFFGINHNDLKKGDTIKLKFPDEESIELFIKKSLEIGLDGFMINSNEIGYNLVTNYKLSKSEEIHYSIPYPHKYASIVNENGMLSLLNYLLKETSFIKVLKTLPKFIFSLNIIDLLEIAINLEVPKTLPKGSYIYLQNIITDLIIGLGRFDIIEKFVLEVRKAGYNPGLITLNPVILDNFIHKSKILNKSDLIMCFNINNIGFNVFPNNSDIEKLIKSNRLYQIMGMSIFASGGSNIKESIEYIKNLNLDYVVFGSSKLENVKSNFLLLK